MMPFYMMVSFVLAFVVAWLLHSLLDAMEERDRKRHIFELSEKVQYVKEDAPNDPR